MSFFFIFKINTIFVASREQIIKVQTHLTWRYSLCLGGFAPLLSGKA